MSGQDWTADPSWQRWVDDVRTNLLPKLTGTAAVMSIVPGDEPDVKYAVELGLSIMLDKPIILIVHPGRTVPEHLRRVADAIVEADLDTPTGQKAVTEFVRDRLTRLVGGDLP